MVEGKKASKRVDIVHVQLVKETSLLYSNRKVRSPQNGAELFREFLGEVDREHFLVMCLNTKNEPTHLNTVHIGSLNASIVHPREVIKPAILSNAASIMVCHNHPSDNVEPSSEDIEVTKRLQEVGEIVGIELLNHIILGEDSYLSFRERGYM
ncbi:JAB domain-containing protein [Viridibacillus sp. FSL H8-0123]|uniref:JAB domain-containing protein n=1 Tax=Viridibacillus sp. FSL H8-0123 TaxID=1928922 RepID=UPI00096C94B2|nr:JAB domain-containing protein [Viridibacillus sp. FSL H8-0123]OMC81608.1 DNA repair protein RadC [Viridibacillus sp. FSL H8-0123]